LAYPTNPHFSWPFGRDSRTGKVGVVEQLSPDHIRGQEFAVVITPQGWRSERPDFGWVWPEFANFPLDLRPLEEAIERFVPDSNADVSEWGDVVDQTIRHIRIQEQV
jgi:phage baseplate assembly protein W